MVSQNNPSSTGVNTPTITTPGYTLASTYLDTAQLSLWLWYGQFTTAQASATISYAGSHATTANTGFAVFNRCPSATLDLIATRITHSRSDFDFDRHPAQ